MSTLNGLANVKALGGVECYDFFVPALERRNEPIRVVMSPTYNAIWNQLQTQSLLRDKSRFRSQILQVLPHPQLWALSA